MKIETFQARDPCDEGPSDYQRAHGLHCLPGLRILRRGSLDSMPLPGSARALPERPRVMEVRAIDVQFSDEVGERTGSWKGGTIGCGYNMLPGESPLDTLRRMEAERKF